MKKLMIAAAIVCAAAFSQAATVNWNATGIGDFSTPTGWATMAFYTGVGDGSAAIVAAINNGTASSLAFDQQPTEFGFTGPTVYAHDATAAGITDTSKHYDFYVVVFNNESAAAADQYAMVADLDKEYSGMSYNYTVNADFTGATWNDIGVDTPEPTSGLLLLIGVAGLALKRKRA